jgi:hypothetical protein
MNFEQMSRSLRSFLFIAMPLIVAFFLDKAVAEGPWADGAKPTEAYLPWPLP